MKKNNQIRISLFKDWSRFQKLSYQYPLSNITQIEKCTCAKLRPVCYCCSLEGEIKEKYVFCPDCAQKPKPPEKNKTFKYKGWLCEWHEDEQLYYLFTPDELEYPKDMRTSETEASTIEQAKSFISSY